MTNPIPLEVLFGNPEHVSPQVSPDDERLACIRPLDGVLNVWVGSLAADDMVPVTRDSQRGIQTYGWAHDNRHLLYIQDSKGDENWHLFAVDLESGKTVDCTPLDGVQARVAGHSHRRPHELLVGLNADDRRLHDLYHLDLETAALTKVAKNPGFDQWLVDLDLKVRGGRRTTEDGGYEYAMGGGEPATWPVVYTVNPENATHNTHQVLGFDAEGSGLYLLDPTGANAGRLVRFDPSTGSRQVLLEDPTYDVAGAVLHPEQRHPQLATVVRDRSDVVVLDPAIAADVEVLQAQDPGDLQLLGRDHADRTWIVGYVHDDGPISYFCYDRETKTTKFLFDQRPALRDYQLAQLEPFSFSASDRLVIHGYATFPPGQSRERLPTVVYVHGGPWGQRHSWGYDPIAQWLASRGYLCLEINYRGSGGYGKAFLNASAGEWGGKMHTDLIDGARWAIDQGLADPQRIAIFGGSYGGYSALVGATFTPEFFQCAVAFAGTSNLITFLETIPPYWVGLRRVASRLLGDPARDREFLWQRSPLSRADQIRIPVLIAHGANDPRVKQAESEQIVEAMRRRGVDHDYLLFPDEGHGFVKPENRLRFFRAADSFLAKHLSP